MEKIKPPSLDSDGLRLQGALLQKTCSSCRKMGKCPCPTTCEIASGEISGETKAAEGLLLRFCVAVILVWALVVGVVPIVAPMIFGVLK